MTRAFGAQAKIVARQQGLPGLRMIVVPHPLGGLPAPEVDRIAAIAGAETLELVRGEHAAGERPGGRAG